VSGSYWQVSDSFNTWFKLHSDGTKVQTNALANPITLILSYTDSDLKVHGQTFSFPEDSLKIAQSLDQGVTWTLLPTILNKENKTVAAVTKPDGYYIIAASFPQTQTSTLEIQSTENTIKTTKNLETHTPEQNEPSLPIEPEITDLNTEEKKTFLDFLQSLF